MFPLNSNTPYVKDTGERARLGQIVGGSDTQELPDYGIADAGKVLTVGEDGSLEWNEKGAGGGDAFLNYDFTKMGTRSNVRYVDFSSDGADFKTTNAQIPFSIIVNDITIYLDIGVLNIAQGVNNRLLMRSSNEGLIYRSTNFWGLYAGGFWSMSEISEPDYFNNSTLKIYIDSSNKWHIYKNGVLVFEPTYSFNPSDLIIGASDNSFRGVIRGVRLYNGDYTE